jgi:hypothetical protein
VFVPAPPSPATPLTPEPPTQTLAQSPAPTPAPAPAPAPTPAPSCRSWSRCSISCIPNQLVPVPVMQSIGVASEHQYIRYIRAGNVVRTRDRGTEERAGPQKRKPYHRYYQTNSDRDLHSFTKAEPHSRQADKGQSQSIGEHSRQSDKGQSPSMHCTDCRQADKGQPHQADKG